LSTLPLLFPQSYQQIAKWCRRVSSSLNIDVQVGKRGQLGAADRTLTNLTTGTIDSRVSAWNFNPVVVRSTQGRTVVSGLDCCAGSVLDHHFGMVQSIEGAIQLHMA
jgi:hypothetical protein